MFEGDFEFGDYLSEWGGETAFQYLMQVLQTTEPETRRLAASLLGELRDPRTFSVLVDLIEKETDDQLRQSAIHGLGGLCTMKAAPVFLQALTDAHDQVQLHAALGLRDLLLSNFPVPEQPDRIARIKQVIQMIGETALISQLVHVTQTVRPGIAAYSVLLLEAFTPYVSPELIEQQIQPTLDMLPKAIKTWVSVERRSLSAGL
jgi:hypothetical protein